MTDEQASAIEQRIGARVLIVRTRKSWTVRELAIKAGVHKNTVANIESGKTCSVAILYKIAGALEISASELLP